MFKLNEVSDVGLLIILSVLTIKMGIFVEFEINLPIGTTLFAMN